jgi:hypothetical protein
LLGFQLAHFPQYIAPLIAGIVACRRNWYSALIVTQGEVWLGAALILLVLFVAAGALEGDADQAKGGVHWQSLPYSVWEQLMCMAMIITLLVWFCIKFNRHGTLARRMSPAA